MMLKEDKKERQTVLIVDDTISIINMVKTALIARKYQVLVATSGNTAINIAVRAQPDLILLDILMPEIDGYETCKELKSNEKTKNIPVIFLSALTESFNKVKAFQTGAVDYVTKPINLDELLMRVKTQISLFKMQKELEKTNVILEERVKERTEELNKKNLELEKQNEELLAKKEQLKLSNERLNKTNHELQKAKVQSEESNKLKTEFLNNMSHEVRTPMNGILGFTNMLNKPDLTPERRDYYIGIIQKSGDQLLSIIDDILEISKLETNQVKIHTSKVTINNLLNRFYSSLTIKDLNNKIKFELIKGLSDNESIIYTDELKLKRILNNLLDNALKFTEKGKITLGYYCKNQMLEIYVKDTGLGIKAEYQQKIFERFSQEDKGLKRSAGGLGLGLSIANEFAKLLGGRIDLESEKDVGSTFTVVIPYNPVNIAGNKSNSLEIENKPKSIQKEIYKVLIAEDESINYLYFESLFEADFSRKYELLHVKNGQDAINICKENPDIDLILMDIKMPILNGYEATKEIRKFNPKLPIIAQTAYSRKEDEEQAFNVDCNDYISKPISNKKFYEIMDKYLKTSNNT